MATADFKGRIIVFSIPSCRYCRQAKAILAFYSVPYLDVNLEKFPERRVESQERTGRRTVPQIFFNDVHIGGFDELKRLHDSGSLEELLKEVAEKEAPPTAPSPPPEGDDEDPRDQEIDSEVVSGLDGCVLDEYASLAREIRQDSGLVGKHTHHLRVYKDTFVGRELVQWLVKNKKMSEEQAIQAGRELVNHHFIHHVTHEHNFENDHLFYRFLGEDCRKALNSKMTHQCSPRPANDIALELRKKILHLYNEHLSPDGLAVDYAALGRSPLFESYIQSTAELKRADVKVLSREEKVAFFINVYNALVIHAFVVRGPPNNTMKRIMFFGQTSYIIGGLVYSLNDIENGVLRANRRPIVALRRPFSPNDPRLEVALPEPEPRIHFALVCGARSCPPIKIYSPENVNEELTVATEAFFEGDYCIIDSHKREVSLSMILKWYKADFGSTNDEVLRWVLEHMGAGPKKESLRSLISSPGSVKVKFMHYNWDLNSS